MKGGIYLLRRGKIKNNDLMDSYVKGNNNTSSYQIKRFIVTFDLQKYLNINNIEYGEVASNDNPQYKVHTCPFCKNINYKGNEHSNRFYINQGTKQFICYNCSESGSLLSMLAAFEGISMRAIFAKYLDKDYFEALPKYLTNLLESTVNKVINNNIPEIIFPKEFVPVFERAQRYGKPAYQYWKDRGILREDGVIDLIIAKQLDVRYVDSYPYHTPSGEVHFMNKRMIFPVWTGEWSDRRFVGFQGRDVTGTSELPYYISEGFPKTKVVHNYHFVFEAETITICEGIFDMVKCWDHHPICLFGAYISNRQLELLQQMPNLKNIIIALDPDTKIENKQGHVPFDKLANRLKPFWNVYDIYIPKGKDAGDMTRAEMNFIIDRKFPCREKGLTILI